VDLYIHSPIQLHGVVLNSLSSGTTLAFTVVHHDLCYEKYFGISVVEIVEFKWLLICIYTFPHSDVHFFFNNLETLVDRVH
jgi:hypothetical protein